MYYRTDQQDPDKPTTLSLRDDPEPALQKARAQTSGGGGFARLFGGVGLVVVVGILFGTYNDYLTHKQELAALIARGRRTPAQLSGEPEHVLGGRYTQQYWHVEYSYSVDGRAHGGSARMYTRPTSLAVVFDPLKPAAHRAVGSMEPSRLDARRLLMLGAFAVAFWLLCMHSFFEWLDRRRDKASGV